MRACVFALGCCDCQWNLITSAERHNRDDCRPNSRRHRATLSLERECWKGKHAQGQLWLIWQTLGPETVTATNSARSAHDGSFFSTLLFYYLSILTEFQPHYTAACSFSGGNFFLHAQTQTPFFFLPKQILFFFSPRLFLAWCFINTFFMFVYKHTYTRCSRSQKGIRFVDPQPIKPPLLQ